MLLLTARCPSPPLNVDKLEDYPDKFSRKLKFRELCLQEWWQEWFKCSFDSMVFREKWRTSQRNVCKGDVVLIRDTGKFSAGDYRRGRIVDTFPDDQGHVRTVLVQLYRPDNRRQPDAYTGEGQVNVRMAIQRLVVLIPVEEQTVHGEPGGGEPQGNQDALFCIRHELPDHVKHDIHHADVCHGALANVEHVQAESFGVADVVELGAVNVPYCI